MRSIRPVASALARANVKTRGAVHLRCFSTPEESMSKILREALEASRVEVEDISGGCGSMYKIQVAQPAHVF